MPATVHRPLVYAAFGVVTVRLNAGHDRDQVENVVSYQRKILHLFLTQDLSDGGALRRDDRLGRNRDFDLCVHRSNGQLKVVPYRCVCR